MKESTETAVAAILATDPTISSERRDLALQVLRNGLPPTPLEKQGPPPRVMKAAEVADMLGVTRASVANYAKRGLLTRVYCGSGRAIGYASAGVYALASGAAATTTH